MDIFLALTPAIIALITLLFNAKLIVGAISVLIGSLICVFS